VVRVLVPASDQLAERLTPIGPIVEPAAEIERPDGIVRGPD